MQTAAAMTLFFIAATSLLGGARSFRLAAATHRPSFYLGTLIALGMALWCGYLGAWVLSR